MPEKTFVTGLGCGRTNETKETIQRVHPWYRFLPTFSARQKGDNRAIVSCFVRVTAFCVRLSWRYPDLPSEGEGTGFLVCPASTAASLPEAYKRRGAAGTALAVVGRHFGLLSRPSHLPGVAPFGALSAAFFSLLVCLIRSFSLSPCLPLRRHAVYPH